MQRSFLLSAGHFRAKKYLEGTHKTRKSPLPQLETVKKTILLNQEPLKNQKIGRKSSENVSGKMHSANNLKEGALWGFLTPILLRTTIKIKEESFWRLEKISKKSHKADITSEL